MICTEGTSFNVSEEFHLANRVFGSLVAFMFMHLTYITLNEHMRQY
jgi:hypothetical protein